MKQLPRGALGFGALLIIALAAGVGAAVAYSTAAPQELVERAPDSNFPDPVIEALAKPLDVPGTSLSLRPPGVGLDVPPVVGTQAVEKAEDQFGPSAFPEKVTASLAWDEGSARLIWAVSFAGICVPDFGPSGYEHDPCSTNELIVIVDATTGQADGIVAFRKV